MGQVLHGSATTTEAVRRAIQTSQASIRTLAQQYHINPKTVAKWKKRNTVQDEAMGRKQKRSTVLSQEEEALIVAFRKQTLLPLDDCLYALQETIPHLTRSSLHRCLQRHGISRLPDVTDSPAKKKRCKLYRGAEYRGYQASKRRYFCGLKIHLVVTKEGLPVEFLLSPGAWNDAA